MPGFSAERCPSLVKPSWANGWCGATTVAPVSLGLVRPDALSAPSAWKQAEHRHKMQQGRKRLVLTEN